MASNGFTKGKKQGNKGNINQQGRNGCPSNNVERQRRRRYSRKEHPR